MAVKDILLDGRPVAILKEFDQVSREIKAAQTRGSASVIMNRIYTSNSYDYLMPAGSMPVLLVEFTSTNMQFGGSLAYQIFAYTDTGFERSYYVDFKRRISSDGVQRWTCAPVANGVVDTGLKIFIIAQGSGTFTVKKL